MPRADNTESSVPLPTGEGLGKFFNNIAIPYRKKGIGALMGVLLVVGMYHLIRVGYQKLWPYFANNIHENYIMIVVGLMLHTGIALVGNFVMYFVYKLKIPFLEKYRTSDKPWPWESKPQQWNMILKRTLKFLFIVHFVVLPVVGFLDGLKGMTMRTDVENLPGVLEIVGQIAFFMICEDFCFYWCHRTLHNPRIYPYIHKIHHEYNITVTIAAEYAHPIEFLLGNTIPFSIGPKLLGSKVHVVTYVIWAFWRLTETLDGHSGYEFSWSPYGLLPLSPIASYHNFHHSHNVGNYGSLFVVWDTICGTNKHYYDYQEKKKQKKLESVKKEVNGKGLENKSAKQKDPLMKNLSAAPDNRAKAE